MAKKISKKKLEKMQLVSKVLSSFQFSREDCELIEFRYGITNGKFANRKICAKHFKIPLLQVKETDALLKWKMREIQLFEAKPEALSYKDIMIKNLMREQELDIITADAEAKRQIRNSHSLIFTSANSRKKPTSYEELAAEEMEEQEE